MYLSSLWDANRPAQKLRVLTKIFLGGGGLLWSRNVPFETFSRLLGVPFSDFLGVRARETSVAHRGGLPNLVTTTKPWLSPSWIPPLLAESKRAGVQNEVGTKDTLELRTFSSEAPKRRRSKRGRTQKHAHERKRAK